MKKLLLLTCVGSLAFAFGAGAADEQNGGNAPKNKKGSNNAAVQQGQTAALHATTNTQIRAKKTYSNAAFRTQSVNQTNVNLHHNQNLNVHNNRDIKIGNRSQFVGHARIRNTHVAITNNWKGQNFSNPKYAAFKKYHREDHDRDWWKRNHSRIVFYFGAPYFWDNGYWEPCWGYNPGFVYEYDGPIYGYDGLPPDQVLTTVQTRLQQEGYYQGAVDGTMGPLTRQALADFQADHGLAITAAVDESTMAAMGLG